MPPSQCNGALTDEQDEPYQWRNLGSKIAYLRVHWLEAKAASVKFVTEEAERGYWPSRRESHVAGAIPLIGGATVINILELQVEEANLVW